MWGNRVLVGVGGAHSSSGKTTFIEALLGALTGGGEAWGAIKCTPTSLYTSVSADPALMAQTDKDTARYLRAGASEVLWVQAPPEEMDESLTVALHRMPETIGGIIVEGNRAIELSTPDIVIFIFGEEGRLKPSGARVMGKARIIISGESGFMAEGMSPDAMVFGRGELQAAATRARELIYGE